MLLDRLCLRQWFRFWWCENLQWLLISHPCHCSRPWKDPSVQMYRTEKRCASSCDSCFALNSKILQWSNNEGNHNRKLGCLAESKSSFKETTLISFREWIDDTDWGMSMFYCIWLSLANQNCICFSFPIFSTTGMILWICLSAVPNPHTSTGTYSPILPQFLWRWPSV